MGPWDSWERLRMKSCGARKRLKHCSWSRGTLLWGIRSDLDRTLLQSCSFLQSPAFCQPIIQPSQGLCQKNSHARCASRSSYDGSRNNSHIWTRTTASILVFSISFLELCGNWARLLKLFKHRDVE